jgi:hypothetical protein
MNYTTYVPIHVTENFCGPGVRLWIDESAGISVAALRVTLLGRFLGRWRVRVRSADGHEWWATGMSGGPGDPESGPGERPGPPAGSLWDEMWHPARANNFAVSWRGACNTTHDRRSVAGATRGGREPLRRLAPRALEDPFPPGTYTATLEYRDAFDKLLVTTAPLDVLPAGSRRGR